MRIRVRTEKLCLAVLFLAQALGTAPQADAQVVGGGTGVEIQGVECRNDSTGNAVRTSASETEWDCAELGLGIGEGDRVAITIRGQVPLGEGARPLEAAGGTTSVAPLFVGVIVDAISSSHNDAADFDLDGDLDLLLETAWVEFVSDDPPVFETRSLPGADGFRGTRAVDLNGDGRPDAAYSSSDQRIF